MMLEGTIPYLMSNARKEERQKPLQSCGMDQAAVRFWSSLIVEIFSWHGAFIRAAECQLLPAYKETRDS